MQQGNMHQKVYYKIKGLNFKKFLNTLKKNNLEVYEFVKLDYNFFSIGVKKDDEKLFLEICNKMNYEISLQNQTILLKTGRNIRNNLTFFISCIFIFIVLTFSCNMVYKIEIYGLENVSKAEVMKVLNDNGYRVGKTKSHYNLNNLELILKQNINKISFASSIIKGNTLLINVNEKIDNDKIIYDYKPFVSPYDCIIKNINLKSGTPVVKSGDIVKKGAELILPYITYKDGTQLKVEAKAEIEAYVEISNTIVYNENHTELKPSGRVLKQSQFNIFGLNLGCRGENINFSKFKTETKESYPFKNFLIPIKKIDTFYYELVETSVYVPFNKVMQNIIEQNKNLLYNNMQGKTTSNIEYETTVSELDNTYYITTYLKTNIIF